MFGMDTCGEYRRYKATVCDLSAASLIKQQQLLLLLLLLLLWYWSLKSGHSP
jgi:hypothetical protein